MPKFRRKCLINFIILLILRKVQNVNGLINCLSIGCYYILSAEKFHENRHFEISLSHYTYDKDYESKNVELLTYFSLAKLNWGTILMT
jgi:hypothetical protein